MNRISDCCGAEINDDRAPVCSRCGEPQVPPALRAPHSNDTTSKEAAESIAMDLNRLEFKVFDCIRRRRGWGATDYEIELYTGLGGNTVRPRRRTLILRGLIRDSGQTRITGTGRRAIVWTATVSPTP